ncbi:MAG: sigma 54-interacting transcriptional regulator [Candidatus Accumulibacter sp.]|jgi:transcriptional regulator with PAS, ATPase and Fis domain|nr:sigma 54-interacting transcriptional regulator [Accumulibacter sp.]
MPDMVSPEMLHDYERIRSLAMPSLFESLEDLCKGTVIVDRNARIVWINERYATLLGAKSAADAIGREVEEVIPCSLMRKVVTTGHSIPLDLMEANGKTFVVMRALLRDERGEIVGAVGFALFDQVQPLKPLFVKLEAIQQELAMNRRRLAEERCAKYNFSNFVGSSPVCVEVKRQARRAAQLDTTVLLLGETGTGKELLAHTIHGASTRAGKPFVGVNVAAIPETLLETEFFGAVSGACTGADKRGRKGKFEVADGGTLFLDEIGDMPLQLQSKLLRVLQEQEFEPVGSDQVKSVNVRVIAATSADLQKRVARGTFRADLYYRLNVLPIRVPPLRERTADMGALCEYVLEQIGQRTGMTHLDLSPDAIDRLCQYRWPGNIRELRNVLEKAVMLSDKNWLSAEDLEGVLPVEAGGWRSGGASAAGGVSSYARAVEEFEREFLSNALSVARGKVDEAARILGLARATLYRKLKTYGLLSQE